MRRVAGGIALAALGGLAGCVLYLAGGPLLDNDVWWHLAHGRAYLAAGPWLDTDPCLGTADRGPIPHQWLFAVAARGVELAAGLPGLRWLHALAAVSIGGFAFAAFRREAAGEGGPGRGDGGRPWIAPAALATAIFLALAWYRLVQLRPDLLTLAGVLLLQRLLFAPALPSGRQIALAALLVAVWANVHAAFLVGPLLILAALAGALARCAIARRIGGEVASEDRRAKRLAGALAAVLAASLLNPRGIAQHLAYLESSRAGAIRMMADEWARFDPFAHTNMAPAVSPLAWLLADAVIAAFLVWLAIAGFRLLRHPTPERLEDADPVRAALGAAGLVAMLSAIRFLFLGVFPLLFLLHAGRRRAWGGARDRLVLPACAAATLAIALAFPIAGGFREVAIHLPPGARGWLAEAHTGHRFFEDGVRFLEASGVSGQLFHDYALGGYLCHRLAPRLRTFVDGSMNYPEDVAVDYQSLIASRGARPEEGLSAALDRRGIDVYFGFGVPVGGAAPYTSAALEGHPDWRRVSRSWRHGVYLRANEANRENLARIAAWYAGQGVAFDPQRGFDPGLALRERRAWAEAWGVLPSGWASLADRMARAAAPERIDLLDTLGLGYALAGAYPEQIANDREAVALQPRAPAPRRRLVYGLLRSNLPGQALAEARALVALDPRDARSRRFLEGAQRAARATSPEARIAAIDALPLLTSRQPLRQ